MDNEIIPSHYTVRSTHLGSAELNRYWGLYQGEVIGIILPTEKTSITKRVIEYRVATQMYRNGTYGVVELPHCLLINPLANALDKASWTLRASDQKTSSKDKPKPGIGSKVLVQCVNGDPNSAIIVGGVRDYGVADLNDQKKLLDPGDINAQAKGHNLEFVFNGMQIVVDLNGALTITRHGPTKDDGKLNEEHGQKDAVGSYVTLDAKGGIKLATVRPDGDKQVEEQSIVLDHTASKLTITTKKGLDISVVEGPATITTKGDVTVTSKEGAVKAVAEKGDVSFSAPKGLVKLGGSANQPVVLGDDLASWLQELIQALTTMTVATAVGPSSPPVNAAAFAKLGAKVQSLLSKAAKVAKSP